MKALVVKRDVVSLNNTSCDYELSRKRPENTVRVYLVNWGMKI